jgi:predicted ThiF/HesA family dinucleotide-utilizing enzyme
LACVFTTEELDEVERRMREDGLLDVIGLGRVTVQGIANRLEVPSQLVEHVLARLRSEW